MALFGVHHEWGKLGEVVVGIAPADDLVVFHEDSQRWLSPAAETFSCKHAGQRLIDVDRDRAMRIERQVEALAGLLAREGVVVHCPQRLSGDERRFLAANGEGNQLFVRDAVIVVADHVIDASLRLRCRQRERFDCGRSYSRPARAGRACRWDHRPGWTAPSSKAATYC